MTLEENGAPYEIVPVDLMKGEHKQPAHLARQPFGQIPALTDGDFTLYESRAMARYVDETRGAKLTPKDAKKKALVEQWISLETSTFTSEISGIVFQRIFLPNFFGGKTDEEVVAKHVEKLGAPLKVLDTHLAKNKYVAGEEFSLADVFFMPYLNLLFTTPEKKIFDQYPNVLAWWGRISSRPTWQKVLSLSK
jgi:glutathione S-transferase